MFTSENKFSNQGCHRTFDLALFKLVIQCVAGIKFLFLVFVKHRHVYISEVLTHATATLYTRKYSHSHLAHNPLAMHADTALKSANFSLLLKELFKRHEKFYQVTCIVFICGIFLQSTVCCDCHH